MLLGAAQSHSLNVTGGSTATKWNFIQSQTLTVQELQRKGPGAQCSILGAGQGRALAEGQSCLAYNLRPRVAAAVAWPLPMLGAWLCAPVPFLTELYKGLLKKKIQAKCFEERENTGNGPEHGEHPIPATGVEGGGRGG